MTPGFKIALPFSTGFKSIIDESEAEVVRTIFDLYLSGLSVVLIIVNLRKETSNHRRVKTLGRNVRFKQY